MLAAILLNLPHGISIALKPWKICDAPTIKEIVDIAIGDTEAVAEVIKHVEKAKLTPRQETTVATLAPVVSEAMHERSAATLRAIASDRRRLTKLIEILRVAARDEEEAAMIALILALE